MQRIKFVLWERYRAWWGAYRLNENDPFLLDRMKAEEVMKKEQTREETLAKMSKKRLRKMERKRIAKVKRRRARRGRAEREAKRKELQDAKDAQIMAEFQRLAAGGASDLKGEEKKPSI
jgi:hypothetical protein